MNGSFKRYVDEPQRLNATPPLSLRQLPGYDHLCNMASTTESILTYQIRIGRFCLFYSVRTLVESQKQL